MSMPPQAIKPSGPMSSEQKLKLKREVDNGIKASRYLEDEFFLAMLDTFEARQYVKIHRADLGDANALMQAKAGLDAGREFKQILTTAVERGTVANGKLEAAKDADS